MQEYKILISIDKVAKEKKFLAKSNANYAAEVSIKNWLELDYSDFRVTRVDIKADIAESNFGVPFYVSLQHKRTPEIESHFAGLIFKGGY